MLLKRDLVLTPTKFLVYEKIFSSILCIWRYHRHGQL